MKSMLVASAIGLATLSLSGCVDDAGGYNERPSYGGYYGGYYSRPNPYDGAYRNAPRYRPHYDGDHNDRPRPDRPWSHRDEPRRWSGNNDRRSPDGRPPRDDNGGNGPGQHHFDRHGDRVIPPDNGGE